MIEFQPSSPEWRDFSSQIASFTLGACVPLYWHDGALGWPKTFRGGSSFAIRFGSTLVGITAAHVVRQFEHAAKETPTVVCQLRLHRFDLMRAIIDIDDDLDVATFAITDDEWRHIGGNAVDCRNAWPPPTPDEGRAINLVGFPENIRVVRSNMSAEFAAYGAFATVEAVTELDIIVTFDPARDRPMASARQVPPLGYNMSGCSGGPAFTQGLRNGLHRWFAVGILIAGPRDGSTGDAATFDMIRIRRIDRINADGTIRRPDGTGWLPRVGM